MSGPLLVAFGGLPGTGKTTIARELARRLGAAYLRIDTLEHSLAASGAVVLEELGPGGYCAAAALAVDNLNNGLTVVVDSVNPFAITRDIWRQAAREAGVECFGIEVFCSDSQEHRRRVEGRRPDAFGIAPPTWREVEEREYHPWTDADLRLDTAMLTSQDAVELAMKKVTDGTR